MNAIRLLQLTEDMGGLYLQAWRCLRFLARYVTAVLA